MFHLDLHVEKCLMKLGGAFFATVTHVIPDGA